MWQRVLDKANSNFIKDTLKLEIRETDNQLLAALASEIATRNEEIAAQNGFEQKANKLLNLKDFLEDFRQKHQVDISRNLEAGLYFLALTSCLYTDLCKGLLWIDKVNDFKKQGSNKQLYLMALYTAVDCFEGMVFRAM